MNTGMVMDVTDVMDVFNPFKRFLTAKCRTQGQLLLQIFLPATSQVPQGPNIINKTKNAAYK